MTCKKEDSEKVVSGRFPPSTHNGWTFKLVSYSTLVVPILGLCLTVSILSKSPSPNGCLKTTIDRKILYKSVCATQCNVWMMY